ncbi:Paf1 complex component [Dinochytrium kinnereticum]|nr:Paf1 complex component [Dinochytrium kinnereticum]
MSRKQAKLAFDLKIPQLSRPSPNHCYLAKLPNYFKADPRPFDGTLSAEDMPGGDLEEESVEQARLAAENTIRWRYADADSEKKDSNARLVRWSDNSFSLLLGEELFEVSIKKMNQDHQYLVALHEKEAVMHTCSRFTNMMMFAPASTSSAIHRKLTMSIRNRHQKSKRAKLFSKIQDPEALRREAEKRDKENWKAQKKLMQDRKRVLSHYDDGGYKDLSDSDGDRRPTHSRSAADYDNADFLDDDDEDDEDYRDQRIMKSKSAVVDTFDDSVSEEEKSEKTRSEYKVVGGSKRRIVESDDDD